MTKLHLLWCALLPAVLSAENLGIHNGGAATTRNQVETAPFSPPSMAALPAGPLGDSIRLGERLINETRKYLPSHVGNGLECASCHLEGGRLPNASPLVGLTAVFPEFRARNGRMNSLLERINDCFERSMNGKPLDFQSKEMNAILTYIWWISKGVPTGVPVAGRGIERIRLVRKPDGGRGKLLFEQKCAKCHGTDGQGKIERGKTIPPLWGDGSFNIGAGMARLSIAAAFIRWNMPPDQKGSLTDLEAGDIAQYVIYQPRPDYAGKTADYPNGGRPDDARY